MTGESYSKIQDRSFSPNELCVDQEIANVFALGPNRNFDEYQREDCVIVGETIEDPWVARKLLFGGIDNVQSEVSQESLVALFAGGNVHLDLARSHDFSSHKVGCEVVLHEEATGSLSSAILTFVKL